MSTQRRTERLAGILLMLSFFLYLFHIVVVYTHGIALPAIFLALIYGFTFSAASVALYLVFRDAHLPLALLAGFWLVAQSLFGILEVCIIQAAFVFPDDFSFIPTVTSLTALSGLEVAMDKIGRSSTVFQGLGLLSVAVLAMRTKVIGSLVGWFGAIGASSSLIASLVSLANLATYETLSNFFPLIALVNFLFILILGIKLFSRGSNLN